ncbi:MAG: penicillin-binding protein 2 [Anaerolineales bacterium]|nr:penicillin-binding protein 2 [Anaerolineales bacterium]
MRTRLADPPARMGVFYVLLVLATLGVIGRLFELQVLQHQRFADEALENVRTNVNIPAPRGVIYDRNGVILARNLPSYNVAITPADLPDDPDPFDNVDPAQTQAIYRRLSELLDMPIVVPGSTPRQACVEGRGIKDWVDEGRSIAPFTPVLIKCDISETTAFIIRQEIANMPMPGVSVIVEPVRDYPTGPLTANIVGYMARIPSPADAPLTYDYYVNVRNLRPERDRIGVAGIEASLQDTLAGQNGLEVHERDVGGRFLRVAEVISETIPGLNVQLTIDVRLQAAVEAAFHRRLNHLREYTRGGRNLDFTSGVVIVMNPNTGEVLAMVTWPTYDNNRFARNIDYEYYVSLAGDPARGIEPNPDYPLLNHAVSILYPPGSVFKVVTAVGALEEGIIDPNRELEDPGKIEIRNAYFPADPGKAKEFICWISRTREGKHGLVDFTRGIAESCNVYFYKIGGGYEPDRLPGLGIGKPGESGLGKWMWLFGFGQRTGIELPAEQAGFIPSPDWKRINQGESWSTGDTYNAVIGQGFVQVTPLQMLNAYNAVINGGLLLKPQIVDKILDGEGNVVSDTVPTLIRRLPVSERTLQLTREGLRRTVVSGTLSGLRLYGEKVPIVDLELAGIQAAGKTGTAEYCDRQAWLKDLCIPGRWPAHAWTFMYAPYDNPEVSVIVFVYNGSEGSLVAGPIANDVLRAYYQVFKGVDLEEVVPPPATEQAGPLPAPDVPPVVAP